MSVTTTTSFGNSIKCEYIDNLNTNFENKLTVINLFI